MVFDSSVLEIRGHYARKKKRALPGTDSPLAPKLTKLPRYEIINVSKNKKTKKNKWNMDIFGVPGVTGEAELLSAITSFFSRVGLTSRDVGIKVSSRKVVQSLLEKLGVTKENFAPTCVIVDKLDKLPKEEVEQELAKIGLEASVADSIIEILSLKSIDELASRVGENHEAVLEIKELLALAEDGGFRDYLQFDASVVRGLAYYTGIVFEGFDKDPKGIRRAICGGGRYDRLLSTFGAKEDIPACGFGFGDCVIIDILTEKKLLPVEDLKFPSIDDVVFAFDESLRGAAMKVCGILRQKGRSVDMILPKKKKIAWAYSYADRVGARRVVLVAPDEWKNGTVRVKNLRISEENKDIVKEENIPLSNL